MTERNLLLVDDEPNIPKALKRLLRRDGYNILIANSGKEALQLLPENNIGVIISDHRMPVMTGIEFLSKVKQQYPEITRIVLSGFSDLNTVTEAINQGNIYKFIAKPWDDTQLRTTIQEAFEHFELRIENHRLTEELKIANIGLLQKNAETSSLVEQIVNHNSDGILVTDANRKIIFSNPCAISLLIEHYKTLPGDELTLPFKENQIIRHTLSRTDKDDLMLEVRSSTITHEGKQAFLVCLHDLTDTENLHNQKQRAEAKTKKALLEMAKAISMTIEQKDPYAIGHQDKVANLALAIGQEMDLDEYILEGLSIGGLIHDIGKIHIPSEILNRPGPLNKKEHLMVQEHPNIGFKIMSKVDFPWPITEMILQHHEYIDGSGYPNGITGDKMALESKILAVVDVVSAMSEERPYRKALKLDEILDYLKQTRGIKFDVAVVDSCCTLLRENKFQLT